MAEGGRGGHEPIGAHVKPIALFAAGLAGVIVLVLVVTYLLMTYFLAGAPGGQAPTPGRSTAPQPASVPPPSGLAGPAGPRLQRDPAEDLRAFKASEDAALGSYGWVDRQAGTVRIPVDRAMDLVMQRGVQALPPTPGARP